MKLTVRETVIFGLLGAMMFASKVLMDALPNIHLLSMFTILFTRVYRKKALYPILIFVLLTGLYGGFGLWWIPFLYLWPLLWAAALLLPVKGNRTKQVILSAALCSAHGFLYGTLYAPAQALLFGLDFNGMLAWIAAGLGFDMLHGISNFCTGLLIVPLGDLLHRLNRGLNGR